MCLLRPPRGRGNSVLIESWSSVLLRWRCTSCTCKASGILSAFLCPLSPTEQSPRTISQGIWRQKLCWFDYLLDLAFKRYSSYVGILAFVSPKLVQGWASRQRQPPIAPPIPFSLAANLARNTPPDAGLEVVGAVRVARIVGNVQLFHVGHRQSVVMAGACVWVQLPHYRW